MEEKFWEKFKVLFSLGPINRVIRTCIPCPRRPRINWLITSQVSKPCFFRKKLIPGERCEQKILKKIPKIPSQLYQPIL